jgi:hypothetical protein
MITFSNSFHNTSCQVRADIGDWLTQSQIRRIRKTLCGQKQCACGGDVAQRGEQAGFSIESHGYDHNNKLKIRIVAP